VAERQRSKLFYLAGKKVIGANHEPTRSQLD
jgi:hypothetical protein